MRASQDIPSVPDLVLGAALFPEYVYSLSPLSSFIVTVLIVYFVLEGFRLKCFKGTLKQGKSAARASF